jgi:hypothetical protein
LAKFSLVNSVVDSDRPNGDYADDSNNDGDYADVRVEDSLLILQFAEAFWTCANNGRGPYGPERWAGGGELCEIIDCLSVSIS